VDGADGGPGADTAAVDTAAPDTAPPLPGASAADLSGEKGGFGCAQAPPAGGLLALGVIAVGLGARRRRSQG
jgi:hypothetical protein